MKILYIVFWSLGEILTCSLPLSAQPVDFFREKIELDITDSVCTVTGTYYFRNASSTAIRLPIFYPVVVNDSLPLFPKFFAVQDVVLKRPIFFTISANGIRFNLACPPLSISIFKVLYRQPTPYSKMEYILTTTQNWGKPLEKAEYLIRIPSHLQLLSFSLEPAHVTVRDSLTIYSVQKESFFPRQNLVIYWERKKP